MPRATQNLFAALASLFLVQGTAAAQVVINEVRTDQPGVDDPSEYIELAGAPGTNIQDYTIVVIGDAYLDPTTGLGGSGSVEEVIPLAAASGSPERTIPSSGYFVIAQASLEFGVANLVEDDLRLENNDNITIFLVRNYSGSGFGQDLDADDNGVLDFEDDDLVNPPPAPWTNVIDAIAIIEEDNPPQAPDGEYHYGPPTVGPNGIFSPGYVYLCPDGDNAGAFVIGGFDPVTAEDTPGQANACPTDGSPDAGVDDDAGFTDPTPDAGTDEPGLDASFVTPTFPATRRDRPGVFCSVGGRGHSGAWMLIAISVVLAGRRRRRRC